MISKKVPSVEEVIRAKRFLLPGLTREEVVAMPGRTEETTRDTYSGQRLRRQDFECRRACMYRL